MELGLLRPEVLRERTVSHVQPSGQVRLRLPEPDVLHDQQRLRGRVQQVQLDILILVILISHILMRIITMRTPTMCYFDVILNFSECLMASI